MVTIGMMKQGIRSVMGVGITALLCVMPVRGAEKVYEKPSAFLDRHFAVVPKASVMELSRAQQEVLESMMGHAYSHKQIRYWRGEGKCAWILEEIGKTEPITTGFLIKDGAVVELKVLIYRESHGWEVSRPFFTRQFVGARLDGDRVDREIDGIVGATLSVRALTRLTAAALYLDQQVKP